YGGIRLRLYRRERALWLLAQPARRDSDDRRLLRWVRKRGRWGPRATHPRLPHQWVHHGTVLPVWHFWPEADLRPAVTNRRLCVCREPRSRRTVCPYRG